MITVNTLANTLPINGITTGEVSDAYPNLFAPAGFTFAIWGFIYFLLAGFVVYTSFKLDWNRSKNQIESVSKWFIFSSVMNVLWIFSWHYRLILLSVFLMVALLISLIRIQPLNHRKTLTWKESIFLSLPFQVYFGWITVATIANVTTLLVAWNWNGWGLAEETWTVIILFVGAMITILTLLKNKDVAYAFVVIWAYFGILAKHLSESGFNQGYPSIILAVVISMGIILGFAIRVLLKERVILKMIR